MQSKKTAYKNIFFTLILAILTLSIIEITGWVLLHTMPDMQHTRQLLLNNEQNIADLNTTGQPYLLYISAPNFTSDGYKQHNADGYRGSSVPLRREANTIRLLFMGGSTTYGDGVSNPEDSYPAQVVKILAADPDFSKYKIEIMNTGIRYGTSAEALTHYLFKYRYYNPDMVILNPGGNDPMAYGVGHYQPDFSNWRKTITPVQPLRPYTRFLLQSHTISAIVILLFYPEIPQGNTFVHGGESMPTHWFTFSREEYYKDPRMAPMEEIAFYRNNTSIAREIKQDGAAVFFLSYQGNPFAKGDQHSWRWLYDWEESILKRVAEEQQVGFAPFPLDQIPKEHWVDPSHNNAIGYGIKAKYVAEKIKPSLLKLRGK
jgi:lysophospholipase L1-like esterase